MALTPEQQATINANSAAAAAKANAANGIAANQSQNIVSTIPAQNSSTTAYYTAPRGGATPPTTTPAVSTSTTTPAQQPTASSTSLPSSIPSNPTYSAKDSNGNTFTYQIDQNGNVVNKQYANGQAPNTNSDTSFSAAQANLLPTNTPSEDQFFNDVYSKLQPVIDAINQTEASAETEANIASTKATSASNFSNNAQGLAGSSEADARAANIEQTRDAAIQQAKAQQATAIGQLVQWAVPEAYNEYSAALSRNDSLSQNYIAAKQTQAQNTVKAIGQQGQTLDDLQQSNPLEYNQLLQYYQGDVNTMKADWISGNAANEVDGGKPIQAGSSLIYTFKDPITGKIYTQSIDTGVPLSQDYTTSKDASGGLYLINKATGQTTQLSSGDPYYEATKAATLAQKNEQLTRTTQLVENAKALEATKIVGSQISTDLRIQNFLTISPYIAKLQGAQADIQANGINETNAAELIDSATKINTGGQAITQGQTGLIQESQSYADQLTALGQKVSGQGGVIDPKIASDILDLSTKIFNLYSDQYKQAVAQYNTRLQNVNGQDLTQYNPLTDITNLPAVANGSYQSGLESTNASLQAASQGSIDTTTLDPSTQDVPAGTYTGSDGNTYTVDDSGNVTQN